MHHFRYLPYFLYSARLAIFARILAILNALNLRLFVVNDHFQSKPKTRRTWFASLIGYAFLNAGGAALQKGLGFVLFIWLAHALPVADYARFGLLFALQSVLIAAATSGISESLVLAIQSLPATSNRRRLLDAANGVFLFLVFGALVGAGTLYVLFVKPPLSQISELAFVLISGAIAAFFTLQAANVRLEERHWAAVGLSVLAPLIALSTAFIGFLVTRSVIGFFAGLMVGSLASVAVFRYRQVGHFGFQLRWSETARLRTQVPAFLSIAMLSWMSGYGITYAVQMLFDVADVAKYTFLFTISAILQLVATAANQVWTPVFYRLYLAADFVLLESHARKFYLFQSFVVGLMGAIILNIMPVVIDLGGGNLTNYENLTWELYWLFVGYAVCTPWWHTQNHFVVEGFGQELNRIVLVSSLVGLVAWAGLVAAFGMLGVYAGFAAQMLLRSAMAQYRAMRNWNTPFLWQGPVLSMMLLSIGAWGASQFPL